ncbi:hypothetical protein GGTG_07092 [Gaeumannomyces tritici R3-111a-1]|uniref:Signal peptidase subunit 3 n=1 Tax=Gaeumannomyces tritici (strain R3-111a-1) TaxID=644352 RepID=J3P0P7_GAET3|nr:hypothetical protein GGTG_07092 [Gaeumannomyces tritici R3-111a-1]EJT77180.1 hypothetical protein GGTG_07092 [Gaeumannomyces tritici R3-111a-1]
MYNSLVRIQNTFGFFTTVAFVVGMLIAATDVLSARDPSGSLLKATNVQVVRGRPHYYSTKKEEYAIIKFSMDADLSSLFTWNTKQVFVYVTAEWPAAAEAANANANANATNQAVIWDTIITSPSADHLSNLGPATLKKLIKSAKGKSIDPSRGILKLKNQRPKYQITHPSGKIASAADVRLRLHYNVQPWVGVLAWDQTHTELGPWATVKGGLSAPFPLPAIKVKETPKARA